MNKVQNVMIKGTKDGITLFLDDLCSYDDLKRELAGKLSAQQQRDGESNLLHVKVNTGNRYLTEAQRDEIVALISERKYLVVDAIDSNVLTKEEAEARRKQESVTTVSKMIRSGQVLEVPGDLLLIGDVNPGGIVMAGGNIFIMGILKGIAHAGCHGNREAVIAASVMKPSQLRISHYLTTTAENPGNDSQRDMECAYINETNEIVFDRLQALSGIRPGLSRFEGGR
ncbi:septum site-determining protein MinC [Neobacillus piezotolerans]|uniref:Probable septum site-determining protein MinC n=1 Tax=Neobacillus piezotolerans TaxID=2259171 RepID=A0A3D8GLV4_9BACI|nr:septum site-determining protein MinC [Neobacillus piezotolerans]RDU35056.1 septum site-determining protein MinC [Neobacillus piezotolerans]